MRGWRLTRLLRFASLLGFGNGVGMRGGLEGRRVGSSFF